MTYFSGRIESGPGGGHFIVVPDAAAKKAGLRYRMRVRGCVDEALYRSSLMKTGETFCLGVHKATLAKAGKRAGDTVRVGIEEDREPLPEDEVPAPLAKALQKSRSAKAAWDRLAPSHRREHVKYINEAKKEETRAARVERTIKTLTT
jgi:hypothetical protein